MAAESWWWPLPAWLGSEACWFVVLNVVVAAIAVLSSRARPTASPRSGGVTRRASSVLLQRLRTFSIFSFPSACFNSTAFMQPDAAAQETEEPVTSPTKPSSRAPPPAPAAEDEEEEEEEEDPNALSMEEAYALAVVGRRPEREREEEARRTEVDAETEFNEKFKEDLRQQRLNSMFNYTQMLKQRALAGRRQPDARPNQF